MATRQHYREDAPSPNDNSPVITPLQEKSDILHIEKAEVSSSDSLPFIDPEKEKALVRKIDWHVIPLVMLLYLNSFIDRYVRLSPSN